MLNIQQWYNTHLTTQAAVRGVRTTKHSSDPASTLTANEAFVDGKFAAKHARSRKNPQCRIDVADMLK